MAPAPTDVSETATPSVAPAAIVSAATRSGESAARIDSRCERIQSRASRLSDVMTSAAPSITDKTVDAPGLTRLNFETRKRVAAVAGRLPAANLPTIHQSTVLL